MPLGSELDRLVVRAARQALNIHENGQVLKSIPLSTCVALGASMESVAQLRDRLVTANSLSVDALAFEDEKLAPAAKALIASVLLPREWKTPIWSESNNWLGTVARDCLRHFDEPLSVGFITFNYDRLIERRLTHFVAGLKGWSLAKAWEQVKARVPIVHIHGQLGEYFPGLGGDSQVPSHPSEDPSISDREFRLTQAAARSIALAGERSSANRSQVEQARQLICESKVVMFLGFGFAPENMAQVAVASGRSKRVRFSSFGMGAGRVLNARSIISDSFSITNSDGMIVCDPGECPQAVDAFADVLPPGSRRSLRFFQGRLAQPNPDEG